MTENQINEMFKLMTTAVTKLNEYDARFERLETGQDELRRDFSQFREETNQNFVEVKKELRQMNRKVNTLNQDMFEMRNDIKDLDERVEVLEEKEAA